MIIPEWLQNQNNVLLIVVLFLVLWLWVKINQRQEKDLVQVERKMPLDSNELGRMVFIAVLRNDLRTYRSLFLNAREAKE